MDFDHLLERFFGTREVSALTPEQLLAGTERLRLQMALERDRGRRFALWALLYLLGSAPDLDPTFKEHEDREAARDFMDMADREIEASGDAPNEDGDAAANPGVTNHIFGSDDLDDDGSGF